MADSNSLVGLWTFLHTSSTESWNDSTFALEHVDADEPELEPPEEEDEPELEIGSPLKTRLDVHHQIDQAENGMFLWQTH